MRIVAYLESAEWVPEWKAWLCIIGMPFFVLGISAKARLFYYITVKRHSIEELAAILYEVESCCP